ncbi:hypothetical protein HanPSC8_Chr11g0451251 [Helianthus annuus]|nr:hypothetical protein HanPSC8_Chr11g0451251 [Helianthus annuus]
MSSFTLVFFMPPLVIRVTIMVPFLSSFMFTFISSFMFLLFFLFPPSFLSRIFIF